MNAMMANEGRILFRRYALALRGRLPVHSVGAIGSFAEHSVRLLRRG